VEGADTGEINAIAIGDGLTAWTAGLVFLATAWRCWVFERGEFLLGRSLSVGDEVFC
jgi:hypothetical protein